jgi:hypothetical protein
LLLHRCLRKDPTSRLRDIGDVRIELEDLLAEPVREESLRKPAISRYRGGVPRSLAQFAFDAPENGVFIASFNGRIAMSPDGNRIAFNCRLTGYTLAIPYLRSLSDLESQRLKEVRSGGTPIFSPDGHWIGIVTNSPSLDILKVARSGDAPVRICSQKIFGGATWAEGDIIYWMNAIVGLMSVPAAGGQSKAVTRIDSAKGEHIYKYPCALPGGNVFFAAATADTVTWDDAHIMVSLRTPGRRSLYWKVVLTRAIPPNISSTLMTAKFWRSGSIPFAFG